MPEETPQQPTETTPPVQQRHAHTYDDDVAQAMNTTDATAVQELIAAARAREVAEKDYRQSTHQRKWYAILSAFLLVCALGAFGYTVYHYWSLTVPVQKTYSVGVFPNTSPRVATATDIRQVVSSLVADTTLEEGKPMLVPLVFDTATLVPLSREQFFSFIEATPSEPFVNAISVIRLGIMNTGDTNIPFVILSVSDPQVASKEFLIAEKDLLQFFYRALGIDMSKHVAQVGKEFESTYMYNLPVRVLSSANEDGTSNTTLLYAYTTDTTLVVTQSPQVLKAIYDTIMRQQ